jgi:hypothetical protein
MPKVKISEYSATANSNTDVASINIDEGCAPSGINNAIRAIMGHLKDFQQGTNGDPFNGPVNGTVGATTASTANVTTLTTSSTVTHNGGTANGVAYLNGSKVLTTGSALTWDTNTLSILSPSNSPINLSSSSASNTLIQLTNSNASKDLISRFRQNAGAGNWYDLTMEGSTNAFTIDYNDNERLRIDSSGNLGVGVTSITQKLQVLGNISAFSSSNVGSAGSAIYYLGAADAKADAQFKYDSATRNLSWKTSAGASDMMTLDASGNLLVGGTTSYGGKIQGINTYIRVANGTSSQNVGFVASDQASNEWHFGRSSVDGYYYVVRQTGTGMYMNTNAWVATSDIRAKENIVPLESSLAKINSLNPVRFTFKKDGMADVGFIAQEMYEQIPEVVDKPEDEKSMMGISKEKIIPFLVKAIQEQQAIITQLTARITALEGA